VSQDCVPGSPGVEVCDGLDNDCDGQVDNGVKQTFYADNDNDGYGNPDLSTLACSAPSGYVSNDDDCDDSRNYIYPGALEVCDGLDNDCDGSVDEDLQPPNANLQDGVCIGQKKVCAGSNGWIEPDYAVIPNYEQVETSCDGLDNDCDGQIDEGYDIGSYCDIGICGGVIVCDTLTTTQCLSADAGAFPENCADATLYDEDCDGLSNKEDPDCHKPAGELCTSNEDCDSNYCSGSINNPARCCKNEPSDENQLFCDMNSGNLITRDYYCDENGDEQFEISDTVTSCGEKESIQLSNGCRDFINCKESATCDYIDYNDYCDVDIRNYYVALDNACEEEQETCSTSCSDLDAGEDEYYTQSRVIKGEGCQDGICVSNVLTDFCEGDTLKEQTCEGNQPQLKTFNCNNLDGYYEIGGERIYKDYTCSNGKCVSGEASQLNIETYGLLPGQVRINLFNDGTVPFSGKLKLSIPQFCGDGNHEISQSITIPLWDSYSNIFDFMNTGCKLVRLDYECESVRVYKETCEWFWNEGADGEWCALGKRIKQEYDYCKTCCGELFIPEEDCPQEPYSCGDGYKNKIRLQVFDNNDNLLIDKEEDRTSWCCW